MLLTKDFSELRNFETSEGVSRKASTDFAVVCIRFAVIVVWCYFMLLKNRPHKSCGGVRAWSNPFSGVHMNTVEGRIP